MGGGWCRRHRGVRDSVTRRQPRRCWNKLAFYEEYGVEEYYVYDPDTNSLYVYVLRGEMRWFVSGNIKTFVSPRLGIRFDLSGEEMAVYRPDGQRFLSFEEMQAARERETKRSRPGR